MENVIGSQTVKIIGDATSLKKAINECINLQQLYTKIVQKETEVVKNISSKYTKQLLEQLNIQKQIIESKYSESFSNVKKELVNLGYATGTQTQLLKKMANTAINTNAELLTTSSYLKTLSSSLWVTTRGLQQFGTSMLTSFTLPIVAAGAAAIKTFSDWEQGTISIQRAAGISRKQADEITRAFMEISMQVPITVKDLLTIGDAAAKAGITGKKEIIEFSKAIAMLSQLGGTAFKDMPVESLADQMATIMKAFGANINEMQKYGSMFLAVADAIPGGLGNIIEALRRASPMAATLNLSLQDTTAIVGTLVAAALPASRAGTEVNTMLMDMIKHSDDLAQALGYAKNNINEVGSALGMSGKEIENLKGRMDKDMIGVLDELIRRYRQVQSGTEIATHAQEIFGQTSLKALLPLINNYSTFKELQAIINQALSDGTYLTKAFDLEVNSLQGTFNTFINAVQALAYEVGQDLAPYVNYFLKSFTQGVITLVKGWESLNPTIKAAIFLFGSLTAIVGPLALILNTLFLNPISGMVTFLGMATKTIYNLGATAAMAGAASTQLSLFTASTVAAASGTGVFGAALGAAFGNIGKFVLGLGVLAVSLGKILLVITAVSGALYLLGKALGIKIKLPSMPKIEVPTIKAPTITTPRGKEEITGPTKEDETAAKNRVKELEKELRDKQRARDKELKIIDRSIKEAEKIRDAEIRSRQKSVDEAKDALEKRKEQWEDEKRIEQEKIDQQEDLLNAVKRSLKEAKKQLDELKKARDRDVDMAENQVDYAKMNLEAAQNELKRLKILGKDEYDVEYRKALERVKYWEKMVELAKQNLLKVKEQWQEQINQQEDTVDSLEEQVDAQQQVVDRLKEALQDRERIVKKEIDLLDDEVKVRQKALDDYKKSQDEKIDLMREERDALREKWDEEIEIVREKLDAAREQAQAIKDMGVPELPNVADSLKNLDNEVQKQIKELQKQIGSSLQMGIEISPDSLLGKAGGGLDDFLGRIKGAFDLAKENAKKEGRGTVLGYLEGLFAAWLELGVNEALIKKIYGPETWNKLNQEAKQKGTSIGVLLWQGLLSDLSQMPNRLYNSFMQFVFGDAVWTAIKAEAKRQGISTAQFLWQAFTQALSDTFSGFFQLGWQLITNLGKGFDAGIGWVGNAFSNLKNTIWNAIQNVWDSLFWWGREMMGKLSQGIWAGMNWVFTAIRNMAKWIKGMLHFSRPDFGPLRDVEVWGKDMIITYADAIKSELPYLQKTLSGLNVGLDTNMAGFNATQLANTRTETPIVSPQNTINKNYYIQPGTMIASRGEIRSFVRMLREYDEFESQR